MPERLARDGGPKAIPEPIPDHPGGQGVAHIGAPEIDAVKAVLESHELFRHTANSQVHRFEQSAAAAMGVKHALMVNSGTSALVCALAGLGIGPGDEVLVPAYTYIATAAAVVAVGAVPVITEIDTSLGMDPADAEKRITPRTRAMMPVYMQGVPGRIADLQSVAKRHGVLLVEDCCQCIGGRYNGRMVGSFGDASAWSLNYFKIITCGEGGVMFTNDYATYERGTFASDPALPMWMKDTLPTDGWQTAPFSGNCYRPSEILGALANVQLERLPAIMAHHRAMKAEFLSALDEPRGYVLQHVDDPSGDCGISAAIIVRDAAAAEAYSGALTAEGLPCGTAHNDGFPDRHIYRYWDSILNKVAHTPEASPWTHSAYKGSVSYSKDMCPVTMDLLNRSLRFRFTVSMTREHARSMARAINKVDSAIA